LLPPSIYPFNWPLAILAVSLPYALHVVADPVGPGLDPDTTMGPLNTERQRDYVAGLCEEARGAGAEVLTFGEYTSDVESNFLLPALVLDPAAHLNIVAEGSSARRFRSFPTTARPKRSPSPTRPGPACAPRYGRPTPSTP